LMPAYLEPYEIQDYETTVIRPLKVPEYCTAAR
jgi:hypothetical protein